MNAIEHAERIREIFELRTRWTLSRQCQMPIRMDHQQPDRSIEILQRMQPRDTAQKSDVVGQRKRLPGGAAAEVAAFGFEAVVDARDARPIASGIVAIFILDLF